MKIGIVGSRDFNDFEKMHEYIKNKIYVSSITLVVSGGAIGADTLAEKFADLYQIPKMIFYPKWDKYNTLAGTIRNKDIVEASDLVFAFWDGVSKGTKNTISRCKLQKKKVHVYISNPSLRNSEFKGFEI
jgi:hypothetical protein